MKLNIKKTQIVVFTKGKNQFLTDFFFNGVKLKQVSFYKYLGNLFYENLSFKPNLEFVVKKATKASFLFWKYLNRFHNMKVSEILLLYDSLIVPILLYGCEVWGPMVSPKEIENTIELFNRKMLRRVLKVGDRCTKIPLYCETGRLPLEYEIKLKVLKYLFQIRRWDEKKLCLKAFDDMISYSNKYKDYIENLFQEIGLSLDVFHNSSIEEILVSEDMFMEKARNVLIQNFLNLVHTEMDFFFYNQIYPKNSIIFGFKKYLDVIPNQWKRSVFTRFKIGNHRLNVEIGRWRKVERHLRRCRFCFCGSIEDENHLLFHCPYFQEKRDVFYSKITEIIPNFRNAEIPVQRRLMYIEEIPDMIFIVSDYINFIMNQVNKMYDSENIGIILNI